MLKPQEQELCLDQQRSEPQCMLLDFHYIYNKYKKLISYSQNYLNSIWCFILTFASKPRTILLQYLMEEMFHLRMPDRVLQFRHFLIHPFCSSPHKRELLLIHYAFVIPRIKDKLLCNTILMNWLDIANDCFVEIFIIRTLKKNINLHDRIERSQGETRKRWKKNRRHNCKRKKF